MESFSALDLIVIMIDLDIVKNHKNTDDSVARLNVVRDALSYRIKQELLARPLAEIEAGLKDLKAIESNLFEGVNFALVRVELARRLKYENL
jgi:hypothetical protein